MTIQWQIPPSVLRHLECVPLDRAIIVLLRHSVRGYLPPDDVGYALPITDTGRRLALELGARLRGRLRSLHASPLIRCIQTAEALAAGAQAELPVVPNRLLGDLGVFVLDGARLNWSEFGHERVMHHLVTNAEALPGMARPEEAARFLVQMMLGTANNRPGVHVFVTHDSLVTTTAARLLGKPLSRDDWPKYLEGAFFWCADDGVHTAYRDDEAIRSDPLCSFTESDVVEFARREIAATIGLNTGTHFFLAGGAFKSLLTGRPPRDLDLWPASEHDRTLLIKALQCRGAQPAEPRPFSDTFELAGRVIEVARKTEASTLPALLAGFDIGISAVAVEHRSDGEWSALVHPLATKSVHKREIRLLKPLINWRYALTTLERMRRYADELIFSVPHEEEAEIWRVFETQDENIRTGMIERCLRTSFGDFGIIEEARSRFP